MVRFDPIACPQPQQIIRPKTVKEQIGRSATRAISGHACFAAVRVENANVKIRFGVRGRLHYRDAIRAGAIMPIADAPGKASQVDDCSQLLCFEDYVVVAKALEFGETRRHRSSVASLRSCGSFLRLAEEFFEALS